MLLGKTGQNVNELETADARSRQVQTWSVELLALYLSLQMLCPTVLFGSHTLWTLVSSGGQGHARRESRKLPPDSYACIHVLAIRAELRPWR